MIFASDYQETPALQVILGLLEYRKKQVVGWVDTKDHVFFQGNLHAND